MSSRKEDLAHALVTVDMGKGLDGLFEALTKLGDIDDDFNGNNGENYLWDVAKKFDTNLEYCINEIKNMASQKSMVEKFVVMWLSEDHYYGHYEVLCAVNDKDEVTHISLAFTCGC